MLTIIVTTILISLIVNTILKRFHLPTIIGYIFTGTIIAYGFGLHDAVHNHDLKEIAEFGVVFLMFTIGLEFSIEHLKRMKHEVFVAGSLQIIITTFIVFLVSHFLIGLDSKVSLIISLAIALSSTAIVLKTFNETGEINKRYGQRSLGILIMQDIAVIPILLIIGFMSFQQQESIWYILLEMVESSLVLIAILWIFGKYLLEPLFAQIVKLKSDELFMTMILFLAIGASYLAHILGFSYSLGAFIAGMLIAETKYKHQAEAELVPFRDILLGIFFITVGMQIDFSIIFNYIHIIVLLLIGAMVLKFIIIYSIIRFNENKRVSVQTALSLVQIGEFSLAILELARTNSLIGPPYGQVMIVTIVLSMILTPIILKNLSLIADKLVKNKDVVEHSVDSSLLEDHTVIIGFGEFGRNIAEVFKNSSEFYVAIENNIANFQKAHDNNEPVIFGNGAKKEILMHANIKHAKSVIIAIDNPRKMTHLCMTIQKYISNDKIVVKVHSQEEKELIEELGIQNVLVENELTSNAFFDLVHNK